MAKLDINITGSDNKAILDLKNQFFHMSWVQFLSAYIFVFVSFVNGPKWWPCTQGIFSYLNVMPITFFILYIVGEIIIGLIEFSLLYFNRSQIKQSGFANYFYICGWL